MSDASNRTDLHLTVHPARVCAPYSMVEHMVDRVVRKTGRQL